MKTTYPQTNFATFDWDKYGESLHFHGLQAIGHRVQVCGACSGHSARDIAFCQDNEHAKLIVNALRAHYAPMLDWEWGQQFREECKAADSSAARAPEAVTTGTNL